MRALLTHGEPSAPQWLIGPLRKQGLEVETTNQAGLARHPVDAYHLIMLDQNVPPLDARAICRRLKSAFPDVRVFALVKGDSADAIALLDSGADACLESKAGVDVLMAQVRALLRHSHM